LNYWNENLTLGFLSTELYMKKRPALLIVLMLLPRFSPADSLSLEKNISEKTLWSPVIAGVETLFVNALFTGFTGYVFNYSWARPTPETIRDNFTLPWEWEATDGFKVNQFGHPYQGALYFNSGRANGFNFYESLAFSSFGSLTWEAFGERQIGSYNDVISTTFGAASMGEMFHLLYLEAYAAGIPVPIALFISPMDGLNQLITGRIPAAKGGNLYEFSVYAGAGYSRAKAFEKSDAQDLYSFHGAAQNTGFNVIYGDPFEQRSAVPYKHFEMKTSLDVDIGNYMDLRMISDGYLFSLSPVKTETDMLSMGLSLHFDFVSLGAFEYEDSTIDQYSNALDWSLKYQRFFQNGLNLQLRFHGGFTFFGVSEYYSPDTEDQSRKNYGAGTNVKLFFDLIHPTLGRLSANIYHYYLQSFPGIVPFSSGQVFWLFTDLIYTYRLSEHLSLGIGGFFSMEKGYFTDFPDTEKYARTLKTFILWSL
jgi:hypothetical protein